MEDVNDKPNRINIRGTIQMFFYENNLHIESSADFLISLFANSKFFII